VGGYVFGWGVWLCFMLIVCLLGVLLSLVLLCGLVVVRSFDRLFVYFFVIILLVSVIVTVGCLCLMGLEYRVG